MLVYLKICCKRTSLFKKKIRFTLYGFLSKKPKACPLVGVIDLGNPFFKTLGKNIDVRTDLPSYNIYKNSMLFDKVQEITQYWNKNLIAFAIGCSFTFEHSLIKHGFSFFHINNNKVMPIYKTNIKNISSGPFGNTIVVSMRIIKKNKIDDVINICKSFHWAHGSPIHYGNPKEIGNVNTNKPDWRDAPRNILNDEAHVL